MHCCMKRIYSEYMKAKEYTLTQTLILPTLSVRTTFLVCDSGSAGSNALVHSSFQLAQVHQQCLVKYERETMIHG